MRLCKLSAAVSAGTMAVLAGCGGGGGGSSTTAISTTVVDGALRNALVCFDKNANGACDAAEVQGRTDANGNVTLTVPNEEVGRYPILALVGTDAVDADNGPVTVAYTLSAPADQVAVISPLTTLVQQTAVATGSSTAVAAQTVQEMTGVLTSVFQDFSKVAAPTDGTQNAALVARILVVTAQKQAAAINSTLGAKASDGATITRANLDQAIQKKLLELVPDLVAALNDPAISAAASSAAREAALASAATSLVASKGLTATGVPTVVGINNRLATTTAVGTTTPAATVSLRQLNFTDATNYFVRLLTGSTAQNTPDSANNVHYVDRRIENAGGHLATWGMGSTPARNADLHWSGSAWVNCPINTQHVSSVHDAHDSNTYDYCNKLETGFSDRASFDIGGQSMKTVYDQVRAAGFTNLTIAPSAVTNLLGAATFPAGSKLTYQAGTALTNAIAYYPGSAEAPGSSTVVNQYSAAVRAGGVASTQAANTACNSAEASTNGSNSTSLESLIAATSGTPCVFAPGSFTYQGVSYSSGPKNEWWNNSTAYLGTLGTAPVNSGPAPGYYTTNTRLRVAFKGSGANAVTYYACQERFNNGSSRNCSVIGTGSYTITPLGDARVLSFNNLPAQAAALSYTRVFVERGGLVYSGYKNRPEVIQTARLNKTAVTALFARLGIPVENPETPLALTANSYQGVWDVRDASGAVGTGTTVFIGTNDAYRCEDRASGTTVSCTLTFTDLSTGAFTFHDLSDGLVATGNANFLTGTVSGSFTAPYPSSGTFFGHRR